MFSAASPLPERRAVAVVVCGSGGAPVAIFELGGSAGKRRPEGRPAGPTYMLGFHLGCRLAGAGWAFGCWQVVADCSGHVTGSKDSRSHN